MLWSFKDLLINTQFLMNRIPLIAVLATLSVMTACGLPSPNPQRTSRLELIKVPLTAVPNRALEAAEKHVPSIYLHTAYLTHRGTRSVFKLQGLSHFTEHTIYVTADGCILSAELDRWLSD